MAHSKAAPPPPADDAALEAALSETLDRLQALLRQRRRPRKSVLLVTADAALADEARRALAAHDGEACWVTSGAEAAVSAAARRFDLIVLELDCLADAPPRLQRIRALPAPFGETPVAALTHPVSEALRDAASEAGLDAFLDKPLQAARLIELVTLFARRPEPYAS